MVKKAGSILQRHHQIIEPVVDEDQRHHRRRSRVVDRLDVVGRGAGPAGKQQGHAHIGDQVLASARRDAGDERTQDARDEVPAHEAQVDLVLGAAVRDADCAQHFGQVVPRSI